MWHNNKIKCIYYLKSLKQWILIMIKNMLNNYNNHDMFTGMCLWKTQQLSNVYLLFFTRDNAIGLSE